MEGGKGIKAFLPLKKGEGGKDRKRREEGRWKGWGGEGPAAGGLASRSYGG